jgi:uncharacterized membrane protein
MADTITAYARSVFNSRTMWFNVANFIVAALSMTEVLTIIPAKYLPMQMAIVALVNLWLRLNTVRPVALIAPGTTLPVQLPRLDPPAQSVIAVKD